MIIHCPVCGCKKEKRIGDVNKAKKKGAPIYCSQKCAGIARRKTKDEKKRIKAEYDRQYRLNNHDKIKAKKHEYFKKTYDPKQAAIERKKRMPKHVEYCRRPEYRAYKKQYDAQYRDKKLYGEFAECFRLILDIEKFYEQEQVRQINNLHNKAQKRKKQWQQLNNQNLRLTR